MKAKSLPLSDRSSIIITLLFCLLLSEVQPTTAQIDTVCRHALGMQSKRIRDSFLTSSTFHAPGTKGQYARLERDEGDGAWCPSGYIQPDTIDQYLQIDLPEPNFITNVATQGRYARGLGREYTSSYMLNYSRDGETWFQWSNYQGVKKLQGNADTNTVKRQMLNPGVAAASHVRIIPVSTRTMSVCLRLELYGCHWASGLVSYDIPAPMDSIAGQTNTRNTKYSDDTYDGTISTNWFRNGLGQLTDGVIGGNDLSQTKSRVSSRAIGFDYVGWSRSKSNDVTMTFRFADVRNFTRMRVHCSNDMTSRARLFTSVRVSFSLNGKTFPSTANARSLAYEVPKDAFDRTARFVDVPLRNSIARYVRASFRIGDEYLLVSEVEFDNNVLPPSDAFRYPDEDVSNEPTVTPTVSNNLPVIIGSLLGVIGLLVFIVLGLCYRQHRLRKKMTPLRYSYSRTSDNCGRSDHMVTLEPISRQSSSTGAGVGVMDSKPPMPIYQEIDPTTNQPNDNLYLQPRDAVMSPPPPYQQVPEVTHLYNQPEVTRLLNQPDVTMNTPNSSHYAESSIFLPSLEAQTIQGVSGNNIYAVPWSTPPTGKRNRKNKHTTASAASTLQADFQDEMMSLMSLHGDKPPEFPREKLEVVEQLGEGQFGEVQLCKAHNSLRKLVSAPFQFSGELDEPVLVAVKVLRADATSNAKEDFLKEVRVMSQMQDPNIVHLIAVCTNDEPYAMITEYMENGDLNQYLRSCADKMNSDPSSKENSLFSSNEVLINMCVQIASGMRYLSSHKFVHRDLATRNCLVDSNHSIRIADFGMSRNMYQSDYYRIQGRAVLPIRWMSWECVLMGKFSSASDAWAFGVTLWEIFSFCKLQPHNSLTDQQVIENMHHVFKRTGEEVHLQRPKRCPATLFNLIRQCWKRQPEDRPTFEQLHGYLLEKKATPKPTVRPPPPTTRPPIPTPRA